LISSVRHGERRRSCQPGVGPGVCALIKKKCRGSLPSVRVGHEECLYTPKVEEGLSTENDSGFRAYKNSLPNSMVLFCSNHHPLRQFLILSLILVTILVKEYNTNNPAIFCKLLSIASYIKINFRTATRRKWSYFIDFHHPKTSVFILEHVSDIVDNIALNKSTATTHTP